MKVHETYSHKRNISGSPNKIQKSQTRLITNLKAEKKLHAETTLNEEAERSIP